MRQLRNGLSGTRKRARERRVGGHLCEERRTQVVLRAIQVVGDELRNGRVKSGQRGYRRTLWVENGSMTLTVHGLGASLPFLRVALLTV